MTFHVIVYTRRRRTDKFRILCYTRKWPGGSYDYVFALFLQLTGFAPQLWYDLILICCSDVSWYSRGLWRRIDGGCQSGGGRHNRCCRKRLRGGHGLGVHMLHQDINPSIPFRIALCAQDVPVRGSLFTRFNDEEGMAKMSFI